LSELNLVLFSVKEILVVVSGVMLIQTSAFIINCVLFSLQPVLTEKNRAAKVAKKHPEKKARMTRIEQLKKFLEQNPDDSFVKYALAIEHVNLSDDDTALAYFSSLLEIDPDYTGTYYHLGKLYQRQKKNELAEKTFREGMKRSFGKEHHTYAELQQALNDLLFDEE
jgi:Tfp pilus assembly protein PilF